MRTVFLGTPDFAVPCLEALAGTRHEPLLVVSQPDKVRGRGSAEVPTPVRARARALGLPETVLEKGARRALYERVLALEPEIVIVVAFGHILREPLLNGAPHGCLNVHASLLPRWRGPAPIHRAVVAGDEETGVCTMRLEEGVDTGPVYDRAAIAIGPDETTGELHDRLAALGAELLVRTLDAIEDGGLAPRPQDSEGITHAPLLHKEEGSVDFARPALEVHDRIRGFDPWPGITVGHRDGVLKLAASHCDPDRPGPVGELIAIDESGLWVGCATGSVRVARVQAPGTRWMSPLEYARGRGLELGEHFGTLGEIPARTRDRT